MRILLDTHVFLWAILEPERLSHSMTKALVNPDHELFLSAASIWEIGTKYALGKMPLTLPPDVLMPQQMRTQNVAPLAFTAEHAFQAHKLPLHHRDPFDRMLIAQAVVESLPVMTSDKQFNAYGIMLLT